MANVRERTAFLLCFTQLIKEKAVPALFYVSAVLEVNWSAGPACPRQRQTANSSIFSFLLQSLIKRKKTTCFFDLSLSSCLTRQTLSDHCRRAVFSWRRQACWALSSPVTQLLDLLRVFTTDCGHSGDAVSQLTAKIWIFCLDFWFCLLYLKVWRKKPFWTLNQNSRC